MCRHFDNINTIAKYEYISSIVAIASNIIAVSGYLKITYYIIYYFVHFI